MSAQVSKERIRSRERIQTGQQILDVNVNNRLKVMKANFHIEKDNKNNFDSLGLGNGKMNKSFTLQNSPRQYQNEETQSFIIEDIKRKANAGGTPYKKERANSQYSKVSVRTKEIEDAINFEDQPAMQNINLNSKYNHKRVNSYQQQEQDYLSKLQNQQDLSPSGSMKKAMNATLFESSPQARHYQQWFGQTNLSNVSHNRKLKTKDTFTKIFPGYTHGTGTVYTIGNTHSTFVYPSQLEGKITHDIDRTYTKKMDFIKIYTEEILKISNMRRNTK